METSNFTRSTLRIKYSRSSWKLGCNQELEKNVQDKQFFDCSHISECNNWYDILRRYAVSFTAIARYLQAIYGSAIGRTAARMSCSTLSIAEEYLQQGRGELNS